VSTLGFAGLLLAGLAAAILVAELLLLLIRGLMPLRSSADQLISGFEGSRALLLPEVNALRAQSDELLLAVIPLNRLRSWLTHPILSVFVTNYSKRPRP